MDFLSLLSGSGLSGTDSPNRLVSHDDILHVLGAEIVEHVLDLACAHVEVLACLPLLEVLTYAEDYAKTCLKSELGLHDELLVGLTVVLATL